jgi:hypothetical protein
MESTVSLRPPDRGCDVAAHLRELAAVRGRERFEACTLGGLVGNRPAQCEARRRSTFVPSGPTALFQFFPDYGKRAARLCNPWRTKTDKILAVYSFRLESAEESVDLKISAIGPNCVPTAQP